MDLVENIRCLVNVRTVAMQTFWAWRDGGPSWGRSIEANTSTLRAVATGLWENSRGNWNQVLKTLATLSIVHSPPQRKWNGTLFPHFLGNTIRTWFQTRGIALFFSGQVLCAKLRVKPKSTRFSLMGGFK